MIISALTDYYERLTKHSTGDIAPFGYSSEKISYALVLSADGRLVDIHDIRDTSSEKPRPTSMTAPQPAKRTSGIKPNFLWDKSSYVLGIGSKACDRIISEHAAFKDFHCKVLCDIDEPILIAIKTFLNNWDPGQASNQDWLNDEMIDANFVFRLDGIQAYAHECKTAMKIWQRMQESTVGRSGTCLVSGNSLPIARLHPAIKGVTGSQSSGASIISFNLDAFTSYWKKQGENAPVSEQSAFAYTTALNHLLRRSDRNRQRLQIGDATVVFWAHTQDKSSADPAELLFADLLQPPPITNAAETSRLQDALSTVSKGRPLSDLDPALDPDTQIFVLGLAPNAARLSVRFWERNSLDTFARLLAQHYADLYLEPSPWKYPPAIWRLLMETVSHRRGTKPKSKDIQPLLAGEMTRAVLTGKRYPRSLLNNLIMRMRADGDISSLRVALCKAVLARDVRLGVTGTKEEIPVSLDTEIRDPGYLLGRLFATLENIQRVALGDDVNATIRDRYFGAASATPASIFPVLLRNAQNHLGKIRKDKRGAAVNLEKEIGQTIDLLPGSFPKNLRIESQGRFAIGYYHQRQARFVKNDVTNEEGEE